MTLYLSTYIIDIAALFYLLSMLCSGISLKSKRKRPFVISILLTIVVIFAEAGTIWMTNANHGIRSINILFNILGFGLSPMIQMAIIFVFDGKMLYRHKILLLPTVINFFAVILSPIFKWIFYVDAQNQYTRGKFFILFIMAYTLNYLFLVLITSGFGKRYNYPMRRKMLLLFLFTILGTSIQLINPTIHSSWHCITFTLFLYFMMMSEFDSSFDSLSGLYNRTSFDRAMKGLTRIKSVSIIVLDIDDFKKMNDSYGHDFGDEVIRKVATILRESFDKQYRCYRIGGDEFAIISEEIDSNKLEIQLKRMTKALIETRHKGGILPTISYGYSIRKGEDIDFEKVLKEADEKMYAAKAKLCERKI